MNRQAQAVILLLVGGAVLRASLTDQYLNYVKPGLQPYLVLAGAILVIAGLFSLWYELRPASPAPAGRPATGGGPAVPAGSAVGGGAAATAGQADAAGPGDHVGQDHDGHDHDGHDHGDGDAHLDDGHGHGPGGPKVAWLLLAPVLGLLLVAPPALGSYAAGRSGSALVEKSDFAPLPAGDPVRLTMLDYASRAVFDRGVSLGERRIELIGFAMRGPEGTWLLARMMVSCCAADARPVKVALSGQLPDDLHDEQWLRVTGGYTGRQVKDTVNGETIPFIEVADVALIQAPIEQYES
ncbi:TIGR03943 family protein [Dactylosporangium sp. NBC_01737]|uniref:TIGR03943 family putative permease subunit n=1 Tax=Dactylosporangium sp. NBC_01737 TaxID=2975959 RepID=UPI002E0DCB4A|nr:TIGR03943 family protein [Dactylosporangium sp. NBC_01737]